MFRLYIDHQKKKKTTKSLSQTIISWELLSNFYFLVRFRLVDMIQEQQSSRQKVNSIPEILFDLIVELEIVPYCNIASVLFPIG